MRPGKFKLVCTATKASQKLVLSDIVFIGDTGTDPGFLDWGFKFAKGGSIRSIYPTILRFPHENKIICAKSGVREYKNL